MINKNSILNYEFGRVSFTEKLLFTKHLSVMVRSGIPLVEAFDTLADQATSTKVKSTLKNISADLRNGSTLSNALAKHPQFFDKFYQSIIQISDQSGTLEDNLAFLAKQLAKDYSLRKKIEGAMLYPTLIFFASTVMAGFISLYVLPQLVQFFTALDIDLPMSTKILLRFSVLMRDHGRVIMLSIAVFFVALRVFLNLSFVKPYFHAFLLKIPLFGRVYAYGQLARFTRNMGVLIKSGVPISQSLETTISTMSNLKFSHDLETVLKKLLEGVGIGESLASGKFSEFPGIVSKMISVGEQTGNLEESFLYLSDFYEEEIDTWSKNLSTVLEPILLLGLGLVVLFVALAIISPIYQLTGSIRR